MRSPLIWFGGKGRVAHEIIRRMPDHKVYVEPFGGAAHVLAQKPRVAHEVYNDIDGEVVNFLLVAQAEPERLASACENLPYSRELHQRWKREPKPAGDFERAVRFFYLNRSTIAKGNAGHDSGWRHSVTPSGNPAKCYVNACKVIKTFANRMKGVQIEHLDFRQIIQKYDRPETLFYIDPPYIGKEHHYAGGFGERNHRDLANILNRIQGQALVSYYDHPMLADLYPGWRRQTFSSYKQVVNGNNCQSEELLLMNFQSEQLSLFENWDEVQ